MKLKSSLLLFSCFALNACSTGGNKTTEPVLTSLPPASVTAEAPKNLDLELQSSLQNIWKTYIKENYTDSSAFDVFVITNRKAKTPAFGCTDSNFGVGPDTETKIGVCKINVPKNHSTGVIPVSKDTRASSHDFFKVLAGKALTEDQLIENLVKTQRIPLVFVHGFNVKYNQAVIRAAQIGYDLKYQGPVVLFTWPSGAGDGFFDDTFLTKTYESNGKSAGLSVEIFKSFLLKLHDRQIPINLVVHSMGHQVVIPAITAAAKEIAARTHSVAGPKPIHELILNAPDFDAESFNSLVEDMKKIADRTTIYCSNADKAMTASETLNKNRRLGACSYSADVDTVNVSLVDNPGTTDLGHGYYSTRPILSDIYQVLLGLEAPQRLFIRNSEPNADEKYYLRP